jgi:hypothetical protein
MMSKDLFPVKELCAIYPVRHGDVIMMAEHEREHRRQSPFSLNGFAVLYEPNGSAYIR